MDRTIPVLSLVLGSAEPTKEMSRQADVLQTNSSLNISQWLKLLILFLLFSDGHVDN